MKIFWSWQSDTPGEIGRYFVRDAIVAAIKSLKQAEDILEPSERATVAELHLDQDRQGLSGSPDLARAIFDKIDNSKVFIADVTIVAKTKGTRSPKTKGRKFINPNVGIELGYALRTLGDANTLMVMNTHYGPSDDLPFDLRHKGVSLLYNLVPEANKATIQAESKKLIAKLVPALRNYVTATVQQAPIIFKKQPAKRPPVFFFEKNDVLAKVGIPDVDEIGFGMTSERAISLRVVSGKLRSKPIPVHELEQKVTPQLGAFWDRGFGGLAKINGYGAIVFEPVGNSRPFNELKALTQVFRTGEVWGVNCHLLRDRPEWKKGVFLPAFPFENTCFQTLHRYVKFAHEGLGLEAPFWVQCAIAGINGASLVFQNPDDWVPFQSGSVTFETILRSVDEEAVSAALLEMFEAVYNETPFPRPKNQFNFPPGAPSASAALR